jgi:carbon storage regulator
VHIPRNVAIFRTNRCRPASISYDVKVEVAGDQPRAEACELENDSKEGEMLVLSRKQNDAIVIGDDIRITVVRVDRNQVRLGIEAPSHVTVLREELILDGEHHEARKAWDRSDKAQDPAPAQ